MDKLRIPNSVTNGWINYIGLSFTIIVFIYCISIDLNAVPIVILCTGAYAIPIILLELRFLKTPYRESTGLQTFRQNINLNRSFTKLLGLYFTFVIIFCLYWLFPEYRKPFYNDYWPLIKYLLIISVVLSIPYFIWIDAKSSNPYDAYWVLGNILCLESKNNEQPIEVDQKRLLLTQHCLAWTVKGFFLPIMFISLTNNINYLYEHNFVSIFKDMHSFFNTTVLLLYSIDVLIALTGYLFTIRLFDAHIRSTESTCFGWVVCIICYLPFVNTVGSLYVFNMEGQTSWINWIKSEYLLWTWCGIVLALHLIYVMATISFGVRFSNLTNRGIITNGPYRFTKHPAYVSKNLFWWLTSVPFTLLAHNPLQSIKAMLLMCGINLIYYFRAKTEEAHLSKDPTYVEYALWMDQHGLFAPIARFLPFLRYKKPDQ